MKSSPGLLGKLALDTSLGSFLGDTRIRLLEAIDTHGSLNRAAKALPLSYKAAWDALDAMNTLAEMPLVTSTTGGSQGGGTRLTDYGRRMVMLYRAMEGVAQNALDRLPRDLSELAANDSAALRGLIKRMSIKTSARNQFVGKVAAIVDVGGMVNVRLRLDLQDEIVATITPESLENMGLALGSEAFALVKAPWVSVVSTTPRPTGLRNVFEGVIARAEEGASTTELTVALASGRMITAVIKNATAEKLNVNKALKRQQTVWAAFPTASVILATYA